MTIRRTNTTVQAKRAIAVSIVFPVVLKRIKKMLPDITNCINPLRRDLEMPHRAMVVGSSAVLRLLQKWQQGKIVEIRPVRNPMPNNF